jgi:hypothetical protein
MTVAMVCMMQERQKRKYQPIFKDGVGMFLQTHIKNIKQR